MMAPNKDSYQFGPVHFVALRDANAVPAAWGGNRNIVLQITDESWSYEAALRGSLER